MAVNPTEASLSKKALKHAAQEVAKTLNDLGVISTIQRDVSGRDEVCLIHNVNLDIQYDASNYEWVLKNEKGEFRLKELYLTQYSRTSRKDLIENECFMITKLIVSDCDLESRMTHECKAFYSNLVRFREVAELDSFHSRISLELKNVYEKPPFSLSESTPQEAIVRYADIALNCGALNVNVLKNILWEVKNDVVPLAGFMTSKATSVSLGVVGEFVRGISQLSYEVLRGIDEPSRLATVYARGLALRGYDKLKSMFVDKSNRVRGRLPIPAPGYLTLAPEAVEKLSVSNEKDAEVQALLAQPTLKDTLMSEGMIGYGSSVTRSYTLGAASLYSSGFLKVIENAFKELKVGKVFTKERAWTATRILGTYIAALALHTELSVATGGGVHVATAGMFLCTLIQSTVLIGLRPAADSKFEVKSSIGGMYRRVSDNWQGTIQRYKDRFSHVRTWRNLGLARNHRSVNDFLLWIGSESPSFVSLKLTAGLASDKQDFRSCISRLGKALCRVPMSHLYVGGDVQSSDINSILTAYVEAKHSTILKSLTIGQIDQKTTFDPSELNGILTCIGRLLNEKKWVSEIVLDSSMDYTEVTMLSRMVERMKRLDMSLSLSGILTDEQFNGLLRGSDSNGSAYPKRLESLKLNLQTNNHPRRQLQVVKNTDGPSKRLELDGAWRSYVDLKLFELNMRTPKLGYSSTPEFITH